MIFSFNRLIQRICHLDNFGIFEYFPSLKDDSNKFYKKCGFRLANSGYFQAINILFSAQINDKEEKFVFLNLAISISLNFDACFIKEMDF